MSPREAKAALWRSRGEVLAQTRTDVAADYGLEVADLDNKSRVPPYPEARHEVMTRLWEHGLSLSEIGRLTGRDHSTVHKAVRKAFGDQYVEIAPGPGKARPQPATDERGAAE